jgi:hypothetical protein
MSANGQMAAGATVPDTKLVGMATELVRASTAVTGTPTTTELPVRRCAAVPAYYYGWPASVWIDRLHRGHPSGADGSSRA